MRRGAGGSDFGHAVDMLYAGRGRKDFIAAAFVTGARLWPEPSFHTVSGGESLSSTARPPMPASSHAAA
jgi:hypothetical protein